MRHHAAMREAKPPQALPPHHRRSGPTPAIGRKETPSRAAGSVVGVPGGEALITLGQFR